MKFAKSLKRVLFGIYIGLTSNTSISRILYVQPKAEHCGNYDTCPVRMMYAIKREMPRILRVIYIVRFVWTIAYAVMRNELDIPQDPE